ncbi:ABC transporter ATP-binding protein [Frigidibacter sp. MR17.14]|uniref:ABC transporter ATP-binding protein n=1 Tax=Frigidibacter sp. MR17.14 TaxID=3126509 RepID=UPI003013166C
METASHPATAAADLPVLELAGLRKTFGSFDAVAGIDLKIREGEFVTIVGPSGSGKTTLLRMLAGLEAPSEGAILLRGRRINDMPSAERPTCLVFQSLALFPHKSVGENIEFPLKVKGVGRAERKARALELLRMVRLPESYYAKNVMRCSGGERQRVALARAFAYDPEVLFFDEPLSALDYKLKKILEKELKDLHRESGKTFVYITHSLEEAMVMSDRIGVMRAGRLVQIGTPEEIYARPADRFVAEFFGELNAVEIHRTASGWARADGAAVAICDAEVAGDRAAALIRPEMVRLVTPGAGADNVMGGTVVNDYSLGSRSQLQVRVGTDTWLVEVPRGAGVPKAGDAVMIGWDAADAMVRES